MCLWLYCTARLQFARISRCIFFIFHFLFSSFFFGLCTCTQNTLPSMQKSNVNRYARKESFLHQWKSTAFLILGSVMWMTRQRKMVDILTFRLIFHVFVYICFWPSFFFHIVTTKCDIWTCSSRFNGCMQIADDWNHFMNVHKDN